MNARSPWSLSCYVSYWSLYVYININPDGGLRGTISGESAANSIVDGVGCVRYGVCCWLMNNRLTLILSANQFDRENGKEEEEKTMMRGRHFFKNLINFFCSSQFLTTCNWFRLLLSLDLICWFPYALIWIMSVMCRLLTSCCGHLQ